jgi:hypothetical protein
MSKREEILEVFKEEAERYVGTMRREDPEEEWRWDYIPPIKAPLTDRSPSPAQKLGVTSSKSNVQKRTIFRVKKS